MDKEKTDYEELSKKYHKFYGGKVSVELTVPVEKLEDFSYWYTPGVAGPCREIEGDKAKAFEYTNKSNTVAVVSDGSRVLGLGDIGPEAGLPVMEGKALLFKYLGGVNAYPLCVDADTEDELVEIVNRLSPSFGGINLEDIESPKCFGVFERLRGDLDIPVWHDDQQGTALVSIAGLIGALKVVGKKIKEIKLVLVGAGAAGVNTAKYAMRAGVKPDNIKIVDSKGIISTAREDVDVASYKYEFAKKTNPENLTGSKKDALEGADACIAASAPGPGVIKKEEVSGMADDAVLFATANPVPEIMPDVAKEAGVRIIGTGRSDFPNQVNNSLGFPAVFRGALDVESTDITDGMCVAAAEAIADRAEEIGLEEDFVIPKMDDLKMYVETSLRVARKAMDEGVARKEVPMEDLREGIRSRLVKSKKINEILLKEGIIPGFPE